MAHRDGHDALEGLVFAGSAITPPAAITPALMANTANRPSADPTEPKIAGPSTRIRLFTVSRKPSVSPVRPCGEWLNISISVIGWPHPMPQPKRNDTSASGNALWQKG